MQVAILCVCIHWVHHRKEKSVDFALFWLMKIQADVAQISQRNIKEVSEDIYQIWFMEAISFSLLQLLKWSKFGLVFFFLPFKCYLLTFLLIRNKSNQSNKKKSRNVHRTSCHLYESMIPILTGNQWEMLKWLLEDWLIQRFHFCRELIFCSWRICCTNEYIVCSESGFQGHRSGE